MAASDFIIEKIEDYFPAPQTGWRAFVNPFVPLKNPALLGVSFQV
jgi:hypothetical protein